MDLPNTFTQTLFKQYTETMKTKEGQEGMAGEEITDELEDALGG